MTTKKQMLIDESKKVIASYTTKLTLRQIYYRLVSKHVIPNKQSEYKYLSGALVEGRLSGAIPWDKMEDRTRDFHGGDRRLWDARDWFSASLSNFEDCSDDFNFPYWYRQKEYIEVWCEKEALANLFFQVTRPLKVVCGICRGYPSIGWLREAATRIQVNVYRPEYDFEKATILYFGDFDPSGLDIERNISDRLQNTFKTPVSVERVAITLGQISQYNIPPMPTKRSDSRSKKHIAKYGANSSVELDAIDPNILQGIIKKSIEDRFDDTIPPTYQQELDDAREEIRDLVDSVLVDDEEGDE